MTQALWHTSATHSELREVEPPADATRVVVRSAYSMISTGTERLVAAGLAAAADADPGAPYVEGGFGFPIKYGYSLVGRTPDGRAVHCLHPHQSQAWVDPAALFALPDALPLRRAALLSNMETVLNGIWDARLGGERDVLLCGFGNIGALLATTLRLQHNIDAVIAETDAWRRQQARALGFATCAPDDITQRFARLIDTSGSAAGLQFCIDHCAPDGTVVELSWFGKRPLALDLGAAFHRNRVRLQSSQVSTIPPHMRDEVSVTRRKQLAAELLGDASYDALLTNELSFADAPQFFDDLRQGREGHGLVWIIRY